LLPTLSCKSVVKTTCSRHAFMKPDDTIKCNKVHE
jgi:hypothetical protein